MTIVDNMKITGTLEIHESKDNGKTFKKIHEQGNLVTDVGFINITDFMLGNADAYEIDHFAVGSGSGNVDVTDTVLETEYDRYAIDVRTYSLDGGVHTVTNECNLASGEGNGTIRKLGLIGHGPTTTLINYNAADPDETDHEWKLTNAIDVLLPNGKVKTSALVLKLIWKVKIQ